MQDFEITKIKLQRITKCIEEYTSEPAITTILNSLSIAITRKKFNVILYSCKEIDKWYQEHIDRILTNRFVANPDAHRQNCAIIKEIISDLEAHEDEYTQQFESFVVPAGAPRMTDAILENLVNRFHNVVIQLRDRYNNRTTLDIDDEYDVQDLLHSLLQLYCDDIRPEEWVPSYAGSASRQDFLLKNEKIVIEVKKTRKGLGNKELGDQLIIDTARYTKHPDCKKLVCFVYDPENRIHNPRGFESDFNKTIGDVPVVVYIRP